MFTPSVDSDRSVLRAAHAAELEARIQNREVRVVVVGLGYIGATAMQSLIEAGFHAHGYDRAPAAVERFSAEAQRFAPGGRWTVGTDEAVLREADVVIVAVRALVRLDWSVDLEPLRAVAATLRAHPRPSRLVVVLSTLPPTTTRRFALDWLAASADPGLFVVHAPERLQAGNTRWTFRNTPHLVAGLDEPATRLGAALIGTFCDTVVPASAPEVTELTKLVENAFMAVGISFIGEVSRLSHALGLSAEEVARAAGTKPFGYFAFLPGPGIGGHCIPNDLQILRRVIRDTGLDAPLLDGASTTSADMPGLVVDHLSRLLHERGVSMMGSRVLVVGVGFKIGSPDTTETPARDVVRALRARSAEVSYLDEGVAGFVVDGEEVPRVRPEELRPGAFEAGILHSGDATVSGAALREAVSVLLDAGGGRLIQGGLHGAYRL